MLSDIQGSKYSIYDPEISIQNLVDDEELYFCCGNLLQKSVKYDFGPQFIGACLVIFFDFLQSDWLQEWAAFYNLLTVVQNCYFLATNRGVKTIFKLKTLHKKLKNRPYQY
jgi:hypothetical protein